MGPSSSPINNPSQLFQQARDFQRMRNQKHIENQILQYVEHQKPHQTQATGHSVGGKQKGVKIIEAMFSAKNSEIHNLRVA